MFAAVASLTTIVAIALLIVGLMYASPLNRGRAHHRAEQETWNNRSLWDLVPRRKKRQKKRPSKLAQTHNASRATAWKLLFEDHPLLGGTSGGMCESDQQAQGYGEPTQQAIADFPSAWPAGDCALTPGSKLYDIGSGFGRLAMGLWLHTAFVNVTGIELNACRAAASQRYAAQLQGALRGSDDARCLGELKFLSGDVLKLGIRDATHVFASAQVWPRSLLLEVLGGELARSAPKLRCVALFVQVQPQHWSPEVGAVADAWGRVAGVHHMPTSWMGAQATFLAKGPCPKDGRKESASTALWRRWRSWRREPRGVPPPPPACRTMEDAIAEARELQNRARDDPKLSGLSELSSMNSWIMAIDGQSPEDGDAAS